ncbi:MAG: glycan-binding surface protein [Bacteroidota bacterium]
MKKIQTYLSPLLFLMLVAPSWLITSCTEDEGGQPVINNVRITEKDSTIAGGKFNLVVAVQGSNLRSVNKVLFNDIEADINPVYITNTNIIVTIPDDAPGAITNTITVFTKSGASATFNFQVVLPEPVVSGVYNEFAPAGSQNKVLGDYFFLVEKVLVGDTEVEIVKSTDQEITFVMPSAVGTDKVTVVAAGGTTTSTFRLNETVGRMINFDIPATGWGSDVCWGDSERVKPEDSDIPVISGKFARIKQKNLAATGYQGDWVFSTCWFDFGLTAGSHDQKMFKFEANVVETWKAGQYTIRIGTDDGGLFIYQFRPWDTNEFRSTGFKTNGWKTFYIPLSDFRKYINDGTTLVEPVVRIADVSKIRDLRVDFNNAGEGAKTIASHYVAIDNLRIVDK